MTEINNDKRPKEQGNLHLNEIQQKVVNAQEKEENTYEIRFRFLLFASALIFYTEIDLSLKLKGPKTKKGIILSFDYYKRTKDIVLNNLFFFDSPQKIFTKSLFPSCIDNNYYHLSCLYGKNSKAKSNHILFNKITNINKNILVSSLKNILNKILLVKVFLFVFFDIIINIIIKVIYDKERREEKRREEKRREEKRREEKRREKIVTRWARRK